MAANVMHNAALQDILGFAAGLRAAIIAQGVDDLESLGPLEDKGIDTIADNICRGVRPDANGQGGVPGFDIDCVQTRQLKKAAHAGRHLRSRMSSPWIAANQINAALLNGLWQFRDYEDDAKNHDRHIGQEVSRPFLSQACGLLQQKIQQPALAQFVTGDQTDVRQLRPPTANKNNKNCLAGRRATTMVLVGSNVRSRTSLFHRHSPLTSAHLKRRKANMMPLSLYLCFLALQLTVLSERTVAFTVVVPDRVPGVCSRRSTVSSSRRTTAPSFVTARTVRLYSSGSSSDDGQGDGRRRSSRLEGNQRPPTEEELKVMDEMIEKLADAQVFELPNAVQRAFRVISSPQFFLRIASRQDQAATDEERQRLESLASNLISTLEAVVSTTEDKLDERAKEVEAVVKAAAEPESGEFMVPLLPERVEAMRNKLLKLDPSSLDEGFLSTLDAWMNKSHKDGMDLMVGILQKVLQMYAGISITRVRQQQQPQSNDGDSDDDDAAAARGEAVFDKLLETDAESWQRVLDKTDPASLEQAEIAVKKAMEGIVLSLEAGSMAQQVQAEYLQEMAKLIEASQRR